MGGYQEYSVRLLRKERVASVLPLQEHWLPLSNLDLLLPPIDVGVFFCYNNPFVVKETKSHLPTFTSIIGMLKASLAQALVTYYPFAGEVVSNSVGEPELLCNNRGVDFVEAYADAELSELRLYDPDVSVEKKLVPKKKEGVLCVQATGLKCGGLVVGCTFDHRIADAYSANMFLVGWAETAQGRPMSLVPCFRRSMLSPRRPGHHDSSLDRLYVPLSSLPPPSHAPVGDCAINRIYFVAGDVIEQMQVEASSGGHRRTKLEAFSAYLWRIMAKAASPNAKVCRLGIVVDGRSRLVSHSARDEGKPVVPMSRYFGNMLSIPYGTLGVQELAAMELREAADAVHRFLQGAVTAEHFRGLIDWVEEHRPEPAVSRIYCEGVGTGEEAGTALVVSSGRQFPVREVDFGWGKPVFGSYHFPWDSCAGYVMPMPSASGDGRDWVVYMHLMKDLVDALESEAGHVFHRLTLDLSTTNDASPPQPLKASAVAAAGV